MQEPCTKPVRTVLEKGRGDSPALPNMSFRIEIGDWKITVSVSLFGSLIECCARLAMKFHQKQALNMWF